uniref:HYDIN/VesB/CFA65-like Ig-like domain-containing protein n=2 Tax=Amphimedon queenslandica TaxID=400682 RepID=A0A1X7SV74_AMPQE
MFIVLLIGEVVYVQLYGTAIDVNVRLDKSSILMESTYIGLCSQRTLTLHNRTDIVSHFEWKLKSTADEEELHRNIIKQELSDEEASSKRSLLDRCVHNPYLRDRVSILDHNFDKRKALINNERFLFYDDVFSIDPVEGELWPHSQIDVTISFQPEKAKNYSSVAYCDVTGRESRLPLRLKGEGLGPKLRFSFDSLDIQNIFVNSAHAYEVILENQGDIDASYSMRSSSSLFGPKFTFNPSSGHLSPDGLQAIQISLSSAALGSFDEEFEWDVEGSDKTLKLRINGSVIGPTFQFDTDEINFNTVSYGFPSV